MQVIKKTNYHKSIPRITTAKDSQQVDIHNRMLKYSLSMGIRMICIILMLFVKGWLLWLTVAVAIILPYVAVLFANISNTKNSADTKNLLSSPPKPEVDSKQFAENVSENETIKGKIVKNTLTSFEEK